MLKKIIGILIFCMAAFTEARAEFLKDYPHLQKFTFDEPDFQLQCGFGFNPFQIIKDRPGFSVSLFQLHFLYSDIIDWEVFNVNFGMTFGGGKSSKMQNFLFRTNPKYRINQTFSIGPMFGYELVRFPDVEAVQNKGKYSTPKEPFSTRGIVYGGTLTESFKVFDTFTLRANQLIYRQTYPTSKIFSGWKYVFTDNDLNQDSDPLKAGYVIALEFAIVY